MTYDKLNRVISRKKTNVNSSQVINQENFTYDAASNITSAANNGTTTAMTYDANNLLTDVSGTKFVYDQDGNMTSGLINGSGTSITYDSSNRLISAGSKKYVYDAENVRLSKADGANKTTYVYNTVSNLSQLLTSTDEKGNVIKYVYGAGSLISQETANGYSYFHYDLRGSTIALTNATGVITNTYEYDAYGKVKITKGDNITPFLYNGRDGVMTEDNGLLYMRSRYYSPDLKRFVNADILAGDIKNSSTLNQYAYVEGNPISMVDPFGLCAEPGSSGNWWSKMTSGIGNYFSSWSFNDVGHTFLDGAGMIPVIGFAFDGTNALWYLAAGDMVNAGLSGTALIPVAGEVAGGGKIGARVVSKAVSKSVKYSDKMVEATELAVKSEDKIADIEKIADDVVDVGKNEMESHVYIPRDTNGNPISLAKQKVNGQDIPLPDPVAEGRPHTVLGGKTSSKTGEVYRQSATFPEGTWPKANGEDVPWSEVHWTNHGRGDHLDPHQHIFEYNPDRGGWIRGEQSYFDGK